MTWKPTVLLVTPTPRVAARLFAWLCDAGWQPLVVSSFAAAKPHIDDSLGLLISEVRLGEFNGLHLALRAQARGIPAVVMGDPDTVLEREAVQLGARYVTPQIAAEQLLSIVQPMVRKPAETYPQTRSAAAEAGVSFISIRRRGHPAPPLDSFRS
jgi:DNA-binding response OmpR family regulator